MLIHPRSLPNNGVCSETETNKLEIRAERGSQKRSLLDDSFRLPLGCPLAWMEATRMDRALFCPSFTQHECTVSPRSAGVREGGETLKQVPKEVLGSPSLKDF